MTIRARKPLLVTALLILATTVVSAEETMAPTASDGLAALAARQQALTTFSARFTWTVHTPEGPREQIGSVVVDRRQPEALRYDVRLSKPDGSEMKRWCRDGTQSWQVEQLLEGETPDVRPGELPEIRRLLACLLLDLPQLSQDFTVRLEPSGPLVFLPRAEADLGLTAIRVWLEDQRPTRIDLEDPHQGLIRLTLTDVTTDQPVDDRHFRLR